LPPAFHPAEVARQLGVSRQSASTWHAAWKTGGTSALQSRRHEGSPMGKIYRHTTPEMLARVVAAIEDRLRIVFDTADT
jgi:hypothetical protein